MRQWGFPEKGLAMNYSYNAGRVKPGEGLYLLLETPVLGQ